MLQQTKMSGKDEIVLENGRADKDSHIMSQLPLGLIYMASTKIW